MPKTIKKMARDHKESRCENGMESVMGKRAKAVLREIVQKEQQENGRKHSRHPLPIPVHDRNDHVHHGIQEYDPEICIQKPEIIQSGNAVPERQKGTEQADESAGFRKRIGYPVFKSESSGKKDGEGNKDQRKRDPSGCPSQQGRVFSSGKKEHPRDQPEDADSVRAKSSQEHDPERSAIHSVDHIWKNMTADHYEACRHSGGFDPRFPSGGGHFRAHQSQSIKPFRSRYSSLYSI